MNPERLEELIQKHVAGDLDAAGLEELSAHLQRDDASEARRKLRLALKADAYLQEAAAEMGRDWNAPEQAHPAGALTPLPQRRWVTYGGIAAALALGVFAWFHDPGKTENAGAAGVASVIRIEGQGRADQKRALSRGDALQAGEKLTMEQGLVEMVFRDTGVHVVATAPLALTANSTGRLFLHAGEVKLHVPPQGVGFVVETVERKITDLGTSFVVTAKEEGSRVFVLDGQITVGERNGSPERLMTEGEVARFDRDGQIRMRSQRPSGVPELSLPPMNLMTGSLPGIVLGFEESTSHQPRNQPNRDLIGLQVMPLIRSGFRDRACLDGLKQGAPLRFSGIAGTYNHFPSHTELDPYARQSGWLAWYHGKAVPPQPGRYRFWGYADNQLLVAVDGKPVFEGSRYDSKLRETLGVPRHNHPAWPCLNAVAGFASGPWIELGAEPVQLDLLFGETAANQTSGLLLVEREGAAYDETYWGQPKWPLFLTEPPNDSELEELHALRLHMEQKLMGSFSIANAALWKAEAAH